MNNLPAMMKEMEAYLSPAIIESAQRCSLRLLAALPDQQLLENNRVLLAYGGEKTAATWWLTCVTFRD